MTTGSRIRRATLWLVGIGLFAASWLMVRGCREHAELPVAPSRRMPDVVLISVDTLRRDHLPIYGYDKDTAPNLSLLASDSVVFENAIAAHTNTGPSHASILTGLYPPSHGLLRNRFRLNNDVETLSSLLARRSYQTVGIVSSIMLSDRLTGLGRGFDLYDECGPGQSDRQAHETWRAAEPILAGLDPGRPMFLFFHLFDPHYPYRAPDGFGTCFLPADGLAWRFPENADLGRLRAGAAREGELEEYVSRYDGEIRYADHHVGLLLDRLRALGRYDGSVIIFLSDHGETLDERPFVFDHGGRAYEEQIRVPLVIHLPGAMLRGIHSRVAAHHVDVTPTVLDILGLPVPAEMQGLSLFGQLDVAGVGMDGSNASTLERPPGPGAGFTGRWSRPPRLEPRPMVSFARPAPERVPHIPVRLSRAGLVTSFRTWPWKLITYPVAGGGEYRELFLLSEDTLEDHNLADVHPEQVSMMRNALSRWLADKEGDIRVRPAVLSTEDEAMLRSLGYAE